MSELLPGLAGHLPVFNSNEPVPFRLTPNMQHFLGPILVDGVLASGIMAFGRCLTEPEYDLDQQLCLFARDEVMTWIHGRGKQWTHEESFMQSVSHNIGVVVSRAEMLACKAEREQPVLNAQAGQAPITAPVVQTVSNLISKATQGARLARMQETFMPWF